MRGEFLVAMPILNKKEIFQSCNLTLHLKKLRKIDQTKESQEAIQSMMPFLGHMSTKTFPNVIAYLMVSEPELGNFPKHQIK